jgi:hypothetical protein
VSLGGCDVPWCNCTGDRLRVHAGNFFALAVHSRMIVLIGGFSQVGVQCTSRWLIPGCWGESELAGGLYLAPVIMLQKCSALAGSKMPGGLGESALAGT